ncbi:MAG: phosphotransferase [Halieaceae bacterium]|nr:phosphotransferase [Halieaceae bacterium]
MPTLQEVQRQFEIEQTSGKAPVDASDLPRSYEEVNPQWLTAVLCLNYPGAVVEDLELGPTDEGTSNRRAIRLTYNESGRQAGLPERIFCKATQTFQSRFVLGFNRGAETEVIFYNKVRDQLDLEAPKSRFANINRETLNSIVILEDIADQVRFCDETTDISRARAESQIQLIAKLHSTLYESSQLDSELADLSSVNQFYDATCEVFGWQSAAENGVLASESFMPASVFARKEEIWPATHFVYQLHLSLPRTFTHGDVHLKNWYITASDDMGLQDWQCAAVGHWSRDLAYVISTALSIENRRAWERELLALYIDRMKAGGVEMPDWDEVFTRYRQQMLPALAMWTATLTPPEDAPEMQPPATSIKFIRRMSQAMEDLDSLDACASGSA